MIKKLRFCVLTVAAAMPLLAQADSWDDRLDMTIGSAARYEFFQLKATEDFQYFADRSAFPWLPELRFVYLARSWGQGRMCYFGVDEARGIALGAATRFICVNDGVLSGASTRPINVPGCSGRPGCSDPMPSIGIGNLRTTPIGTVAEFQYSEDYPATLDVTFRMEILQSSTQVSL